MPGPVALTAAQRDAVRRLVADGVLTPGQGEAVCGALAEAPQACGLPARWLVEVAGYLGGGLMLGGAALFLVESWDELGRAGRSAVLAGFALALVLAGVLVAGGFHRVRGLPLGGARRRVVGVLFALASGPAALAVLAAFDGSRRVIDSDLVAALVGFAVAAAGLLVLPTVAGQVATAVMSLFVVGDLVGQVLQPPDGSALAGWLMMLALGLLWVVVSVLRLLPSYQLGLATGTATALFAAQQLVTAPGTLAWGYGLTFAVAAGCLAFYRWQRSVVLLVAGVLGVTLAVPEAVVDWTGGALGGSLVLVLAGAVLIVASAIGLRIRHGAP